jgi:hypothetical protein
MTYTYDSAGRPTGVSGVIGASQPITYASSATYAAHGGLLSLPLSGSSIMETSSYNSRLQKTQIQVGRLMTLTYGYGTTNNNGMC